MHGGKSLGGVASPLYRTGRYSKYLPARLAGRYQEAQADGELLALREDIALTDARLADVLSRVDTGESGALWAKACEALDAYRKAQLKSDSVAAAAALLNLEMGLEKGHNDWSAWDEVGKLLEQRRRLVESERKRLVEMQQMITAERAMLLITAFVGIIRNHVTDRATLAAISADIGKLVSADGSHATDAAGS